MIQARTLLVAAEVMPGRPIVADVIAASLNSDEVDPASVALLAPHDDMNESPLEFVEMSDDGKHLIVPGEGSWLVDGATGIVTFTPERALAEVTPVSYQIAGKDGGAVSAALLVVDSNGSIQKAVSDMAAQTDDQFWQDFRKRAIEDPVPDLEPSDLLLVTRGFTTAALTALSSPIPPIDSASLNAAVTKWKRHGQDNSEILSIAGDAAEAQFSSQLPPEAHVARCWQLVFLGAMLDQIVAGQNT